MQIIEKRLDEIRPYENNPRNNDAAVEYVANSLREFGWKQPIVIDRDGVIVAGHTRYKAAQQLGMKTAPCVIADDLTPEQVKAYRLADNKTGEAATWDFDALELELDGIDGLDMEQFGFEIEEEPPEMTEDDFDPEPPETPKAKRGQIYQLGNHRLMCGDSTSTEDVQMLMGGAQADISITSPPYGASKSAKIRDHYVPGAEYDTSFYNEHEDDISEWAQLIQKSFDNMEKFTNGQFINIQLLADNKRRLIEFLNDTRDRLVDVIVWDKTKAAPQMQSNVLNNQFEFVFVFGQDNATRTIPFAEFHGTQSNIIKFGVGNNEFADVHRAVFPVEFPAKIMEIASQAKTVLDLFGGTGTTMIAAEQLGRKCYMMELDPKYVDVIINRWEQLTGGKAKLLRE